MDHLRGIMDDPQQLCRLKLELAVIVDVGKHFVTATYELESDGALSLCCFERLQVVVNACKVGLPYLHFPNLHAVAINLARAQEMTEEWVVCQRGCLLVPSKIQRRTH